MRHWKKLATRLAILVLLSVAIFLGRDALIQMALVDAVESTLGAKADIGHLRSSFKDNKLFLKELAIADPRDPTRNLFQADTAVLEIDRDSLWRRKIRIVDGLSTELFFGSPRLHSGTGTQSPDFQSDSELLPSPTDIATPLVSSRSISPNQNWLDRFQYSAPKNLTSSTELSRSAENLFLQLDSSIEQQVTQLSQLKGDVVNIEQLIESGPNPLRFRNLEIARGELGGLQNRIESIALTLTELDREIANGKKRLADICDADRASINRLLNQKQIDGDTPK